MATIVTEETDAGRTMYIRQPNGGWLVCRWAAQCPEKVFMADRCQGAAGHAGEHWAFTPSGQYAWTDNAADSTRHGCAGQTPPGHKHYKHPSDMWVLRYLSQATQELLTDPDKIAKLNEGELENGESLIQPAQDDLEEKETGEDG